VNDKNNFLIRLLSVVIILAVFLFLFAHDYRKQATKTEASGFTESMCPASGWVDCMPIIEGEKRLYCSSEFLTWAAENCPGFEGAAL
jgi:hypothetical protein